MLTNVKIFACGAQDAKRRERESIEIDLAGLNWDMWFTKSAAGPRRRLTFLGEKSYLMSKPKKQGW